MTDSSFESGLDTSGCDRCGERPGGMKYLGWRASTDGVICHQCVEDKTQTGDPESQSLDEVFGDRDNDSGTYVTLEARKDHRYCPHYSEIPDGVTTSSYSHQSSCPECDPGPHGNASSVRRGHALIFVPTGEIGTDEKEGVEEPAEEPATIPVADGGVAGDSTSSRDVDLDASPCDAEFHEEPWYLCVREEGHDGPHRRIDFEWSDEECSGEPVTTDGGDYV